MFRPTDPQLSLLESKFLISAKKRTRLERSWAEAFRNHILPLIDEEAFRDCFCADNGRPNTSIRMLVALHLLKEADDLIDEQVLDALEFNLQWQHALAVEPSTAHVCEKSLHNFRGRMLENEMAASLFQQLTVALVKADGLSAVRQRLDSTHVMSNIATLSRLGVFTETVTHFLRDLRRDEPAKLEWIGDFYSERYLYREGYFADAKRDEARRRVPMVATDLDALVRLFADDDIVTKWASYQLMVRVLREQCEPATAGNPPDGGAAAETVPVKAPKDVGSDSLQSPHDADATYGHKGKGYEAQIAETCVEANAYEVVTGVAINGANESDHAATIPMIDQLATTGLKPDEMLGDTNYGSGANIIASAERGVRLVAPVQDADKPAPWIPGDPSSPKVEPDKIDMGSFTFNAAHSEVQACPGGHAATEQRATPTGFTATFEGNTCAACPFANRCPTRLAGTDGDRTLRWKPAEAATAARQLEQRTSVFKEEYALRSGIESTNAELKGRHGGKKLRVRGRDRVVLSVHLKLLALNTKRAVQHHVAAAAERRRVETAAAGA